MSTKSEYHNGMLVFHDSQTHERVNPVGAPLVFYDDFLGKELLVTEIGSKGIWDTVEVNLNTAIALQTAVANGKVAMIFDSDVNAEDAVLYMGDVRHFSVKQGLVMEFAARVSVAPTLTAQIVMGMAGDHNLDKDAITEGAWFKFDGSLAALCESDDTTNNNDDVAAGVTVNAGLYYTFRIDFTDIADVRFYMNGARVAEGTTFDMSNLTDEEAIMQPYFSMDKGADAGLGTVLIDYVRIWSKRS